MGFLGMGYVHMGAPRQEMRVPGEGVGAYGGPWGWGGCLWKSLGMGWVHLGTPGYGVGVLGNGVGAYGGPWGWGGCIWGSLRMGWGSLGMVWVHLGSLGTPSVGWQPAGQVLPAHLPVGVAEQHVGEAALQHVHCQEGRLGHNLQR